MSNRNANKVNKTNKSSEPEPLRLSMNISFSPSVKEALNSYCEAYGLPNGQDAVRIFVASGLKREGFLK